MGHEIRLATPSDGAALLSIYAPYVAHTAISFEIEVPSVEEFSRRIEAISSRYPYLVYQAEGRIAGYAYASPHRERAAYRYDVETSIYLHPNFHGAGIAHRLYHCLLEVLARLGYCSAYAGYTVPNEKSRCFHERFGFAPIGTFHKTGYKLGAWHDVTWVEKEIRPHEENPGRILGIQELPEGELARLFAADVL